MLSTGGTYWGAAPPTSSSRVPSTITATAHATVALATTAVALAAAVTDLTTAAVPRRRHPHVGRARIHREEPAGDAPRAGHDRAARCRWHPGG